MSFQALTSVYTNALIHLDMSVYLYNYIECEEKEKT